MIIVHTCGSCNLEKLVDAGNLTTGTNQECRRSKSILDHASKPISILRYQNIIADLKDPIVKYFYSLWMMYRGGGGGGGLWLSHDIAITNQNEKSKLSVSDFLLPKNINLRLELYANKH